MSKIEQSNYKTECKLLNGEILEYDLCSKDYIERPNYIYLGKGVLHKVNGYPQNYNLYNEKHIWHFWRKKTSKELEQESIHKEALNQIKQTNHIVYTTTDGENFSMKEKAIQHQEKLNKKYVWVIIEVIPSGLSYTKKVLKVFQTEQQAKKYECCNLSDTLYILKKELE